MKQQMDVSANLYDPGLLTTVVEKLASRHVDLGYNNVTVPANWNAIETSTVQAYIMGTFDMQTTNLASKEQFNVPFTSCFLFTCIQEKRGAFNLEWSFSLS
jgi:hypothetical protein